LVELIFALVALELAGTLLLTAALGVARIHRGAAAGRVDLARVDSLVATLARADCADLPRASVRVLHHPAAPDRPALASWVRCGR
jgi:hypothetical protein